ncbi:hypothetical protein [Myxococcus sp. RHSTA-1-4]|uniref:hypothetical protein n=1 Tax=Myxococcus sp. RHSTA-1-4 TaxID=2874601 RepID=UPI001CC19AC3|nr:hypothetical protein [Myxococcus sp. RHSTA-1-4]MBZ4415366.1 hypothetical protein [Myxococcus sp. RHSTA-1-4]
MRALLMGAALVFQAGCGAVDGAPESPWVGEAEQATRGFLPDLTVEELSRDSTSYKVKFCNRSSYGSELTFTVRLTNELNGQSFQSNPLYPYSVPAPGTCIWTGGFSCGLVGAACNDFVTLTAQVDDTSNVTETYEYNNTMTVSFREHVVLPDLVVEEVVRTGAYLHARYCNHGTADTLSTFAMRLTNTATGQMHLTADTFAVPAQGTCAWTPGIPCSTVGSNCVDTLEVRVTADGAYVISEWSEVNNDAVARFTPSTALADLVVSDVWRQGSTYVVSYCNQGLGTSTTRFEVRLINRATGWPYQTPSYQPLPVPAPGECAQTASDACSVPGCWPGSMWATVDISGDVFEANEQNNHLYKTLP